MFGECSQAYVRKIIFEHFTSLTVIHIYFVTKLCLRLIKYRI